MRYVSLGVYMPIYIWWVCVSTYYMLNLLNVYDYCQGHYSMPSPIRRCIYYLCHYQTTATLNLGDEVRLTWYGMVLLTWLACLLACHNCWPRISIWRRWRLPENCSIADRLVLGHWWKFGNGAVSVWDISHYIVPTKHVSTNTQVWKMVVIYIVISSCVDVCRSFTVSFSYSFRISAAHRFKVNTTS